MAPQIRRSSKSITANIAEGYGRYHFLDSLRFYSIARGEINETLAHYANALVLGYIKQEEFNTIYMLIRKAESTLNGFMAHVRKQRTGIQEYGDRTIREEQEFYDTEEDEKVDR